jgi:hypothetical protein
MAMPLPVTGGVIVNASPMQHPSFAAARWGFTANATILQRLAEIDKSIFLHGSRGTCIWVIIKIRDMSER